MVERLVVPVEVENQLAVAVAVAGETPMPDRIDGPVGWVLKIPPASGNAVETWLLMGASAAGHRGRRKGPTCLRVQSNLTPLARLP